MSWLGFIFLITTIIYVVKYRKVKKELEKKN